MLPGKSVVFINSNVAAVDQPKERDANYICHSEISNYKVIWVRQMCLAI